jgi:hypothetical protein
MKTTAILSASLVALAAATPAVQASPQQVIDRIVDDLTRQGFVRIEIDIERDGSFDVDAYGGGREGDFTFDPRGDLLDADVDDNDDYGTGYSGRDDDDDDDDDDTWDGRDDSRDDDDYDDDDRDDDRDDDDDEDDDDDDDD